MADERRSEVRVYTGPFTEQDAQRRALTELNLLAQSRRNQRMQNELLEELRDAARTAALEKITALSPSLDDQDLAVEVADAVLDTLLTTLRSPAHDD